MTYRPCNKCIGPKCICHEVEPEKLDGRTIQEWAYIARGFGKKSDRLEADCDALSAENAAMDQERSHARLEAMRLAAHVEKAKGIMNRLIETPKYMRGPRPPAVQEYLDWFNTAPATSLARLKAQWQAEARLEFAKDAARRHGGLDSIIEIAKSTNHFKAVEQRAKERRQAEEGDHGD